jgi:SAM-dependent methyltransferase/DNA-binding transcriptional ArsR family regulator
MKRSPGDSITIAETLAPLSEPVRLRLLRVLELEELSVGELASVVQVPQSTVSRHLKILSDTAWLARRTAGTATLYRLVLDDLPPSARAVWVAIRSQFSGSPAQEEDDRRLQAVLLERRMDSQSFFGRVGGEWDELRARLFGADFTAKAMLSLLPREWVVGDLGCGTGNASELLALHVKQVIAVDLSEAMLEAARQRLSGSANVKLVRGALEQLPLDDASVDATVCMLVLHHVPDPSAALKEMRRVLRPSGGGGIALVVDMLEHDREEYRHTMGHAHLGFGPRQIEELMKEAGFANVNVAVLPSDPEAKGPGLFAATGRVTN